MSEQIDTERMATLLDDWAAKSDQFNWDTRVDFGITEAQRDEPVGRAVAMFANFRFVGSTRPSSAGPIVAVFGAAEGLLQFIRDEHPEVLEVWHELTSYTKHPLVTAMLNDMLWFLKYGERQQAHLYARAAIVNYLQFFDELQGSDIIHLEMRQQSLLCRAAELTKVLNAPAEYHGIAKRCEAMFAETHGEDSHWAIRAAACLPAQHRPSALAERIESLQAGYLARPEGETWTLRESLYKIQRSMAEQDKDKGLERQIRTNASQMFINEAKRADSDLRAGRFLQEAEEWAKGGNGESALIEEIRGIRGGLAYDGEFHEISAEQSVPNEVIEKITTTVRSAETMSDAIEITTAWGFKSLGRIDLIEEEAERIHNEPRLINLIGRVHIVHDGIECCRPTSNDAKLRRGIAEHFRTQASIAALLFIAPCLASIEERPEAERASIREILADSVVIDDFEVDIFAKAFDFYWARDYDTAVHIALPRIESTIRMLARKAGVEISFPPQGDECGGLRGLRPILDDLHDVIGASNARMLAYLLVDNHAMNLRDSCAHGVRSQDPHADAALVLWIILWLASLRPDE